MGDTGSMFLGYSCGTLIILLAQERPKWFLAAMVMFALPVLDTVLAFARRYVAGRPSSRRTDFTSTTSSWAAGSASAEPCWSLRHPVGFAILGSYRLHAHALCGRIYLVIFGSIIVAAYKMGMVHERPRIVRAGGLDEDERVTPAGEIDPSTVLEIQDPRHPTENQSA